MCVDEAVLGDTHIRRLSPILKFAEAAGNGKVSNFLIR